MKRRLHHAEWSRVRCLKCGDYDRRLKPLGQGKMRQKVLSCAHCLGKNVEIIARCLGRTTAPVPYVGKPQKTTWDWMKGGNKMSRKGKTGRPKNAVQSNHGASAEHSGAQDGIETLATDQLDIDRDAESESQSLRHGVPIQGRGLRCGNAEEQIQSGSRSEVATSPSQYF